MFDREWRRVGSYFSSEGERVVTLDEGVSDYVARTPGRLTPFAHKAGAVDFQNPHPCHLFRWGLGEVVTAVAHGGLCLEELREHPHSIAHRFSHMRELAEYRTLPPENVPSMPLLYGLRARKH